MKNGLIIEAGLAQPLVMGAADFCGILAELDHVIHHHALLRGERRRRVIRLQRSYQCFIQGDATQKLCVGLDSINTPVGYRDHSGDDLVLAAAERKLRRHERAKGREGVVERVWDQAV